MVKQTELLNKGQIIPTALHQEMERSYLEYAMSVIVGRALPDVRDGLKPVHRRILYAMHELGLTPDRPYRKCARVVGDVLGKYHPHGDQAVYDALVRMVQDFSTRYPLLAGHGNFGSVDNDPPAAMRYTETRLASIAHEAMLRDINEAIVNFTNNFDNSQQEPVILPTQLPILLLNGCSGIAVGMATNIPPHNLGEVVDGLISLIDNPEIPDAKLWEIIPGPDFPTGGEIIDSAGIEDTYEKGRGIITIRGIVKTETIKVGKKRPREKTALVVTELPYQVNKAAWIEKVADLVNHGRLEGIADLRDESDRSGMRVVIELKKDAQPKTVLQSLYNQTPLQNNFGAIMLALVNKRPSQLPLRQLLEEFLKFREETLRKKYSHELEEAQKRLHLLEGLLAALDNLDATIEILRNAPDGTTANQTLQTELGISQAQGDSILAMPMRRLTGLEKQKLQTEYEELLKQIQELQGLLENRNELMKGLKKELRSLKRKFGDERRTRIIKPKNQPQKKSESTTSKSSSQKSESSSEKLSLPVSLPEKVKIKITHSGYISWEETDTNQSSSSGQQNLDLEEELDENASDFTIENRIIESTEEIAVVSNNGKIYPISIEDIPYIQDKKSKTIISLLSKTAQKDSTKILTQIFPSHRNDENQSLLLLTQNGRIKRVSMSDLTNLTNRGLSLVKLKDDDSLSFASLTRSNYQVVIATTDGRLLRFSIENNVPIMGRNAQGNQALRLREREKIVSMENVLAEDNLLLVSQLGYGKRLSVDSVRLANRSEIGTSCFQFTNKTDSLAGMVLAHEGGNVILLTTNHRVVKIAIDSISLWGKNGAGDVLTKLNNNEKILSIVQYEN